MKSKLEFLVERDEKIRLKAYYQYLKEPKLCTITSHKPGHITNFFESHSAVVFLDKKFQTYDDLINWIDTKLVTAGRAYQIDVASFASDTLPMSDVVKAFVSRLIFHEAQLFNKKKKAPEAKPDISLIFPTREWEHVFNRYKVIAEARNSARNLQIMPENFCNSEQLAAYIETDFQNIPDLKVTVLNKAEIEKLGMGLLLSVNRGSTFEPRVVVVEYTPKPESQDKVVLVGKGITFDTGGVNTKGYQMEGMKYDMSGSVIAAYAVKALALAGIKKNAAAVMMITDNRQDGDASLPENVYTAMSGHTVEVSDTDAEGRLVLADGLHYAVSKLNPSVVVDVATLTGTMVSIFGSVYTGVYATDDKVYELFAKAAHDGHEKIWRLPMHADFHKGNTESDVADLKNWSKTVRQDANQAAMFLKEFVGDVPFVHCDIAGTADIAGKPQGALVDTLFEFMALFAQRKLK
ncbi:M17 family metallopeptidase [Mycoplasmopsis columbinasalis]|uniref:Probable cytosol aminopeptidase n=1 Tax=Mycoplasmopsis columbinasalis TaxID=114880 RepID=A0A449B9L7_9BACT|nr:leucyl aminopeptidase family protein [Mycoplasmopsis columbinasalis]VEU77873.1 Probable cytosol aminopeptidase [Mycoplasmopsis columbinasalis]